MKIDPYTYLRTRFEFIYAPKVRSAWVDAWLKHAVPEDDGDGLPALPAPFRVDPCAQYVARILHLGRLVPPAVAYSSFRIGKARENPAAAGKGGQLHLRGRAALPGRSPPGGFRGRVPPRGGALRLVRQQRPRTQQSLQDFLALLERAREEVRAAPPPRRRLHGPRA